MQKNLHSNDLSVQARRQGKMIKLSLKKKITKANTIT